MYMLERFLIRFIGLLWSSFSSVSKGSFLCIGCAIGKIKPLYIALVLPNYVYGLEHLRLFLKF